jgi:hypothetical protein
MLDDFKISRKNLSSFYVAAVFSFLFFQLTAGTVRQAVVNLANFLTNNANGDFSTSPNIWLVFFGFCFVATFLIKKFVITPLGFFTDEEEAKWWDLAILVFLVFGFFVFVLNQTFSFAMPREFFNLTFIKLFGGYKNAVAPGTPQSEEELSGWFFVRAFWYIAPLAWLFFRTKVQIKDS